MKVTLCDICGALMKYNAQNEILFLKHESCDEYKHEEQRYEMCNDCYEKYKAFITDKLMEETTKGLS